MPKLITVHAEVHHHKYMIGRAAKPDCRFRGMEEETTRHILCDCKVLVNTRRRISSKSLTLLPRISVTCSHFGGKWSDRTWKLTGMQREIPMHNNNTYIRSQSEHIFFARRISYSVQSFTNHLFIKTHTQFFMNIYSPENCANRNCGFCYATLCNSKFSSFRWFITSNWFVKINQKITRNDQYWNAGLECRKWQQWRQRLLVAWTFS